MPEMHFLVRWPDGGEMRCYSPSLVVRDTSRWGAPTRCPSSSSAAARCSHRLRARAAKFGYACSAAMDQLEEIEERARRCDETRSVTVVAVRVRRALRDAGEPSRRRATAPPARAITASS